MLFFTIHHLSAAFTCCWRKQLPWQHRPDVYWDCHKKLKEKWMIQTTAAKSAAFTALWAPQDFCSHCRLAFSSSTPPYLFYSSFSASFHLLFTQPSKSLYLLLSAHCACRSHTPLVRHTSVFLWYLLLQICVKLVNSFIFFRCFNVLCHCFIFFGSLIPEHWLHPVSWLIWFRKW